jgi:phenylacetate-coenzyme A ligase PaaK-like adenylate-forming protein
VSPILLDSSRRGYTRPLTIDPVALLIRRALFPAWVTKNRSRRLRYLKALERSQYLPADAMRELQWTHFKAMLAHAYRECPFYRRKYRAAGIHPDDITAPSQISALPTLSKEEIQESLDDMLAADARRRPLRRDMTGGSTGSPMVFYYDEDRLDSRAAATLRHNRWTGWNIGDKIALLWGAPRDLAAPPSPKDRLRDWILDRRVIMDASTIDEERMAGFCRVLERQQPRFVLAYANTLALFARFVRDTGRRPLRPQAIICSGEMLTEQSRLLIESTFGCRVFNRYGSREFAVIASECDRHEGLHVNAENLFVEVADRGAADDEPGEIIVTDLKNYAMPMIRYRTKDAGVLKPHACGCGRSLPLIDLQGGRTTDFLIGARGQKVSGIVLATYGITDIAGVRQVQFVQHQRHRVTARVVRGPAWTDAAGQQLVAQVRTWLGETTDVDVEFTEAIPLEPSGKYRFSISTVSND